MDGVIFCAFMPGVLHRCGMAEQRETTVVDGPLPAWGHVLFIVAGGKRGGMISRYIKNHIAWNCRCEFAQDKIITL